MVFGIGTLARIQIHGNSSGLPGCGSAGKQEKSMNKYDTFLRTKLVKAPSSGFDLSPDAINPALKPHQRDAVRWALKGGRRALFESFGLGKTVQELEWCNQVIRHEGGKALIVLPLGVRQEFTRDAVELLHIAPPQYITSAAQAEVVNTPGKKLSKQTIQKIRSLAVDLDYLK